MFKIFKELIFGKNNTIKRSTQSLQLTKSLDKNIALFKDIFADDDTITYRMFETQNGIKCYSIFAEGMISGEILNENVLQRIMSCSLPENVSSQKILDIFAKRVIAIDDLRKVSDLKEIIDGILYGDAILLIDGVAEGLLFNTKGLPTRSVTEPISESVVRGPREGFTESLNINIALLRRKIINSNLKFKYLRLGKQTKTRICICYIEGLASKKITKEVMKRLEDIEIDGILESGYIEELIKDSPLSPFKTIGHTERPDVVAGKLLEGRVAILCDGTPFVLTLPYVFMEYFQSNEDYYQNFIFASINRLLRYLAFFLTTSIPALYLAIVTFHQEMIPTPLLLSISASRVGVPFPTVFEAIAMGLSFEILREGGVRLPTPIGQAISIVGAIVLGDAAVNAKLVSAPMIIVTALTGISSFLLPMMLGPVIIIRFIFIILASIFGLYGYMFGVIGLFIQLMSMRSFGIPYMLNIGSLTQQDVKDTTLRAPWWMMNLRPRLLSKLNPIRKSSSSSKERR